MEKLWKSRKTMLEVLRDRKYPVDEDDFIDHKEFVEQNEGRDEVTIRKEMTLQYEKTPSDKIMVIWPNENKLGTNIREIALELDNLEVTRAIIVINDSVTNWGKGFIRRLRVEKTYIDIYTLDESQFNIMGHVLVPKHQVCTPSEKKKILSAYSVKPDKIPQIKMSDPVIRHLGANRGNLIKITRESETQQGWECITYRIVA